MGKLGEGPWDMERRMHSWLVRTGSDVIAVVATLVVVLAVEGTWSGSGGRRLTRIGADARLEGKNRLSWPCSTDNPG